jgi:hypothetical protein
LPRVVENAECCAESAAPWWYLHGCGILPPMDPKRDEQYSPEETERRIKVAVQGAFKTEPKRMKDIPPKRQVKQRVLRKKPTEGG